VDRPGSAATGAIRGQESGGSRPTSVVSSRRLEGSPARNEAHSPALGQSTTQTLSFAPLTTVYDTPASAKPEYISYSKGVQTAVQTSQTDGDEGFEGSGSEDERSTSRTRKRLSRRERERDEELREKLRKEIEEELRTLQLEDAPVKPDGKENFPARTLTHEELDAVQGSDEFQDFIERSSKVIERALEEEYDVLADYAVRGLGVRDEEDDEDGQGVSKGRKGRRIRQVHQFQDERWTKKRMISDLDFSPKVYTTN